MYGADLGKVFGFSFILDVLLCVERLYTEMTILSECASICIILSEIYTDTKTHTQLNHFVL